MKKKGFTLIELLAVIVVLAIIAIIATPAILGVVEKARKGSAESSALGYIDAVEKYIVMHEVDSKKYPVSLMNGSTYQVETTTGIKVNGQKPSYGVFGISDTGTVAGALLRIGDYDVCCAGNVCVAGDNCKFMIYNIDDDDDDVCDRNCIPDDPNPGTDPTDPVNPDVPPICQDILNCDTDDDKKCDYNCGTINPTPSPSSPESGSGSGSSYGSGSGSSYGSGSGSSYGSGSNGSESNSSGSNGSGDNSTSSDETETNSSARSTCRGIKGCVFYNPTTISTATNKSVPMLGKASDYYTVIYNSNGGKGTPAPSHFAYNMDAHIPAAHPVRSGYRFQGWAIEANKDVVKYVIGSVINLPRSVGLSITLYAVWAPCGKGKYIRDNACIDCPKNTYSTGTANAACTSCPSGYKTSTIGADSKDACVISCPENTRVAVADGLCTACSSGYIKEAHNVISGSTSSACSSNHYTVTLNSAGGTGGTEHITAIYGNAMPTATMPTREGYQFAGYFTSQNGTGNKYYNADGTSARNWNIAGSTVLYANWESTTEVVRYKYGVPTSPTDGSDSFTGAGCSKNKPCLKYTFSGSTVIKKEVCGYINNSKYICFVGGDGGAAYETNKANFEALGYSCAYSNDGTTYNTVCPSSGCENGGVQSNGYVYMVNSCTPCFISNSGKACCGSWSYCNTSSNQL